MQQQIATGQGTTVEAMTQLGFSAEQLSRLERLREVYPLIELVDDKRQIEQLRFLRWRHLRDTQTA
jgi:hypothetical protein